MLRLENPIKNYAWGSHSAISELVGGRTPSLEPEAELWMGAHPNAPSLVLPARESLLTLIQREPERTLGASICAEYGAELPFLLKVLAADAPLSLQAHPTIEQARAGFEREQARGIALDAAERNYKDRNHKPELICALTPFEALCGFRSVAQTLDLLRQLDAPSLRPLLAEWERAPSEQGLAQFTRGLLHESAAQRAAWARETLTRASALGAKPGPFQREFQWAARLGQRYPDDAGIVTALLLNLVHLAPGEALYLRAGNLHAYLHGVGIELMANSDNVLRGGLTPKHVDARELLGVLDFRAGSVEILRGREQGQVRIYDTPAREFELQRFDIAPTCPTQIADRRGPEILFCERGELSVRSGVEQLALRAGDAIFIAAAEPAYTLSGSGRLFRAGVGRA